MIPYRVPGSSVRANVKKNESESFQKHPHERKIPKTWMSLGNSCGEGSNQNTRTTSKHVAPCITIRTPLEVFGVELTPPEHTIDTTIDAQPHEFQTSPVDIESILLFREDH